MRSAFVIVLRKHGGGATADIGDWYWDKNMIPILVQKNKKITELLSNFTKEMGILIDKEVLKNEDKVNNGYSQLSIKENRDYYDKKLAKGEL
jgi:hypothetical protein